MASKTKVLYIGVTNNLERRILEHKKKENIESFTSHYNISRLVHAEYTDGIYEAICREKQLKNWKRKWKVDLIEKENPKWEDLAAEWFETPDQARSDDGN